MVLHDNGDIFKQMALTHLESKSCRGYIILIISTEFYLIKKSGKGATLMTLLVIFEFIAHYYHIAVKINFYKFRSIKFA